MLLVEQIHPNHPCPRKILQHKLLYLRDVDVPNLSVFLEESLQVLRASPVGQAVHLQADHPEHNHQILGITKKFQILTNLCNVSFLFDWNC